MCVDWCDAAAYCEWAGKRLCGRVGGGEVTVTGKLHAPDEPAADANQSEWYNACSQGGETVFPYGDVYDPLACEGIDVASDGNGGLLPKKDVGARQGCKGAKEPFATVRDLSGSVFEMTNEVLLWNGVWTHALRGGARTSSAEHLSCSFYGTTDIGVTDSAYGFRCCKDASDDWSLLWRDDGGLRRVGWERKKRKRTGREPEESDLASHPPLPRPRLASR